MAKIIGNTTATPNPQPDWLQTDDKKADYIKNKPMDYDAQMNAVSFGTNTHAGGKGFKVVSILENEKGEVVGYELDEKAETAELEVGQTYSVRLDSAAYNCGEITEISGNRIKVRNAPNIKELNTYDDPEIGFVGNILTIKGRPDLGHIDIGFNAFAEGSGNYASEANAHAEGSNNYSLGKASHTEGNGNIAGYEAHAEGSNNKALGDQSHAEGVNNTASGAASHTEGNENTASGKRSHAGGYRTMAIGEDAFAHGQNNRARGENSVAFGYSVSAAGKSQAAFGRFNKPIEGEDALIVVGNGDSENNRSNAFVIYKDGHATVAKAGTEANDVVTYSQIVPKITKPETDKAEYVYTRTPSGGIDLKRCTFHADGSTIVSRGSDGRFKAADPYDDLDVANKKYVDEEIANVEVDLTGYATEQYVDDEIAKSGYTIIEEISPDEGETFYGIEFNALYLACLSDKTQTASFLLRAYSSTYQEDDATNDACESDMDVEHCKPFQFTTSGWRYCDGTEVSPKFEALDLDYASTMSDNQVVKLYKVAPKYAPFDSVYSKSEVDNSFATKQEVNDAFSEVKLYQHNIHMRGNVNAEYRIDAYWTVYSKIDTPATFDDGAIALPYGVDSVASGLYAFEGELCPIQTMRYDDGVYIFKYVFQAGGDYICSEMPIEEIGENFTFTDTVTQIL